MQDSTHCIILCSLKALWNNMPTVWQNISERNRLAQPVATIFDISIEFLCVSCFFWWQKLTTDKIRQTVSALGRRGHAQYILTWSFSKVVNHCLVAQRSIAGEETWALMVGNGLHRMIDLSTCVDS